MKLKNLTIASSVLLASLVMPGAASALDVNIAADLPSVDVMHKGQKVTIQRNQDQNNTVNPAFAKTSRPCPAFCIQPGTIAPGVDTIGELEVLHYLKKMSDGDKSILVIDSRTPDWVAKGTIPGAVNIPWDQLNIGKFDPITVQDILEKQLGGKFQDGFWDFTNAKTLVLFCNGMWCGQSPTNIKGLLKIGYPAQKIKWYRGGMQDWEVLGLTTAKP
jgi:rhodanese-related sulfurtransferase